MKYTKRNIIYCISMAFIILLVGFIIGTIGGLIYTGNPLAIFLLGLILVFLVIYRNFDY